jgi:TolB-like protein/Tfp pilus assembly protein PilF
MAQRRLAAIMFSDIVGYSSLLEQDEKKAFDTRTKNQRIHKRLIKKFNGRLLKEMESGVLASFSSIIDAVMCALSIQKATTELDIPVRIGIHQGEVIFEKKDILGDGVNIASRIQGITDTNEIVISERVFEDIKNKEGLEIEFLGEQELKGVNKPVGIYKVSCTDYSVLDFTVDTGELIRPLIFGRTTLVIGVLVIALLAFTLYYFLPKFTQSSSELGRSVLVLPFNNYLGTDTLDYFVAGMHDALIGDIGKIGALQVKSKTTANAYKDTEKSLTEIADELGVNTFIEGAVLCIGDSICLQVKLFDQEENELWVHDFTTERSQILNLYYIVTKEISNEINVILTPEEEQLLAESRSVDLEAYDAYLKGLYYFDQFTPEAFQLALEYFQKAIEIDPYWAAPHAAVAYYWIGIRQHGLAPPSITVPRIYKNIEKAFELDSNSAFVQYVSAVASVWTGYNWEKGEEEFLKALEINPNDAFGHIFYAQLLMSLKRDDEALEQGSIAIDLDPKNPMILSLYALVQLYTGEYGKAIEIAEKALLISPSNAVAHSAISTAYLYTKEYKKTFEAYMKFAPLDENAKSEILQTFDEEGYVSAAVKLAEEWENADWILPLEIACLYTIANNHTKAMDWCEKGYNDHDANIPYIGSTIYTNGPLKIDDPRFFELLRKLNLPLP